jgi:nucleoside triphosphate pyrophosphatase
LNKPFWQGEQPLVLASRSEVRSGILRDAGIPHIVRPADIDERAVEQTAPGQAASGAAQLLARTKALAVPAEGALVLGADQTLALGARRFSKPASRDAARDQLKALRGHTHELHCAIALAQSGRVLFEHAQSVSLTMRAFSDEFLEMYLDQLGAAVTRTVGAYQVEKIGIQIFDRIEGDHFVILGLPLLPLLHFLRRRNLLLA